MKPPIGKALTALQSPVIFYLWSSGILRFIQRKRLRHREGMNVTSGHRDCERKNGNKYFSSPKCPNKSQVPVGWKCL